MSQYSGGPKRAVAIKYDEDNNAAPVVVATGMGHMAERIVETAVENNVPVFEDNSLTSILSRLELGAQIPEEVYQAVVDIYVYFLNYVPGNLPLKQTPSETQATEMADADNPVPETEFLK